MNNEQLFTLALGLAEPWFVENIQFLPSETMPNTHTLHLTLSFSKGSLFKDATGTACPIHDTRYRKWRHIDFFQHECILHCNVPRIEATNGKVLSVSVPWARENSGFTLLFEALSMSLIEREMPVNKVATLLRVYANRIWTVFNFWVKKAIARNDVSQVTQLGIDETSRKKGHQYLTLAVDLTQRRVIHVSLGKNKQTIHALSSFLQENHVSPEQISHLSMDLSPAYIAGAQAFFPKAQVVFDRFHVVKLLNEAMDVVRKEESGINKVIKGHKYTFLKRKQDLEVERQTQLETLCMMYPRLGEAYRLKTLFNEFWEVTHAREARLFLDTWIDMVYRSDLEPFKAFARTVERHKEGILGFNTTRISNGILEGINSKVQLAKRRARGYRNPTNFINMIYFLCAKLKLDYPLQTT